MSEEPLRLMWTGAVEEIEGDTLHCKFSNGREEIYAEVDINELRKCDREVVQLGSIFYWLVFDDGNAFYMSQYQYTQEDIDRAEKFTEEMRESGWFDEKENHDTSNR